MLYAAHLIGLLVVAAISLLAAWWVRRQTRDRAGTAMVGLLVGHGLIALLTVVQLLGSTPAWQVFWYRLWYLVALALPIVWFLVAVYYVGREHWLTKPVWAILLASQAVPIVLWLADPYAGLVFAGFAFESEPFGRVVPQFTDGWLVLYGLLGLYPLFAFGLFLRQFLFPRGHSRWKPGAVVLGIVAIWITVWLSEAGFVPAPGFPYVQYGNGIFGAFVAVALFRTQFFGVTPLATETIFESIDDAIVVVDARRIITEYNETALELFPDLEGRIGDRLDDAYPALVAPTDCCDGGAETIVERPEGTLDSPFAGTVRVSDGTETRTLRISASEIASGGEPRGYALIARDITELETYAAELERKTDQLEQFAGVLSHDLRNPVSVATGYAQQAKATGDVDHVDDALIALERIEETIDDLLLLSRQGESIDALEAAPLRDVVADAWATSDTDDADLEVDPDLDDGTVVRADPSRLRTLLENLFRNAADHGGEAVRVGLLEAEPASRAGFYVADDGPGVPEDERDRVFEYGYSSDGGTGLGLAIVSSIADAHDWEIAVTESARGGARFEISRVEFVPTDDRDEFEKRDDPAVADR